MKAIVNVNPNWGIGKDNQLLCHIGEDMKRFKAITMNKAIIYGRKTLLSFPGSKPLPHRTNIVVSKNRHNIPEESRQACDYYAYVSKKKFHENDIGISGINFNTKSKCSNDKLRTSLIFVNDINIVEDVGMLFGHCSDDIIVCGGAFIYLQLLPLCDTVYVTKNDYTGITPDSYFPNLDNDDAWYIDKSDYKKGTDPDNWIEYEFLTYRRRVK